MKQLKRYQEKAVNKLVSSTQELLKDKQEKATIIFQSPTGSGKTYMMSQYIEQTIKAFSHDEICFLWISIGTGMLHKQSYYSLKNIFREFPDVYLLENEFHGGRGHIERNEVVIVNWDKLNQKDKETGEWKNSLMKDSETYNFRDVVQNTKELGTKIIMIIDESHSSAKSERALELRDDVIKADLTIEMSATPVISEYDARVKVNPQDVIDEGMIKKEIIVNDGLEFHNIDDITSEELILKSAISKRFNLAKMYLKNELDINPLCLIQLPSGKEGEQKQEFIENYLAENNATTANGKLAIWLSEDKINLDMLNDNESKVEFLIFKQAIATGWDCPRAQVLVRFRDVKSVIFDIQTVGRILRMPEAIHYHDDELNRAFMYINTDKFDVKKEEYNPNIIKSIYSTRKDIYGDMKLRSYYLNRVDYGDVTRSIYEDLEEVFCKKVGLKIGQYEFFEDNKKIVSKVISLEALETEMELIDEKHIDTLEFDGLGDETVTADTTIKVRLSSADLDIALENLVRNNLNGFAAKRSLGIMLNGIRRWFKQYLGISARETFNGHIKIRNIVLSNYELFGQLLDEATLVYKHTKEQEIKEKVSEIEVWNDNWEVSQKRGFNPQVYTKYEYKLSLYSPCYLNFDSNIEEDFIEFLEKHEDKILWWWQNGSEHMALNFGIKYNTKSTFQPDFLVMFKNGRLGIFDTKGIGYQEDNNKKKSEALQEYIKEENQNGKNIFGGVIIKDGEHFKINQKKMYKTFSECFEDWEYFKVA